MRSGRKNDTERHREALKRGIVFSAMGKKVFFNPHVELLNTIGLLLYNFSFPENLQ
jgi:hypothetical protein